ncbi:MAG: sporulation protein YqfC [Firmicutes bacterium]|nr:sporulation protein YqfC [Bacillota bacterium]
MAWQDLKKKVKQQFSEFLEIPGDVALDLPKTVIVGNVQVYVENHRGILAYAPEGVRISTGDGEIAIDGRELMLRNVLPDEICVVGEIEAVRFSR